MTKSQYGYSRNKRNAKGISRIEIVDFVIEINKVGSIWKKWEEKKWKMKIENFYLRQLIKTRTESIKSVENLEVNNLETGAHNNDKTLLRRRDCLNETLQEQRLTL